MHTVLVVNEVERKLQCKTHYWKTMKNQGRQKTVEHYPCSGRRDHEDTEGNGRLRPPGTVQILE